MILLQNMDVICSDYSLKYQTYYFINPSQFLRKTSHRLINSYDMYLKFTIYRYVVGNFLRITFKNKVCVIRKVYL